MKRPEWLKVKLSTSAEFQKVSSILRNHSLNTVCKEAKCPNIWECWSSKTATFLILGDICTRNCGFCAVVTGKPDRVDSEEPIRVAKAIKELGLNYVVITSVTRDDLFLGGALVYAETIIQTMYFSPNTKIEVLIPDFKGTKEAFDVVIKSYPNVIAHNVETVPRLYPKVRAGASYKQSIELLKYVSSKGAVAKSGIMLGLGETDDEVRDVLKDIHDAGCKILTIGQYLQPTKNNLPVERFISPAEFEDFKNYAKKTGFAHVESAALVRSSYHAEKMAGN